MNRRYDQIEHPETRVDAWSEAWGDPALQDLGRQLVVYGVTVELAATVVEQTWLFYSYEALPLLGERLPMGISTKASDRPEVWFYLPLQRTDVSADQQFSQLHQIFKHKFAAPLADCVAMLLEPVTMEVSAVSRNSSSLRHFEVRVRDVSARKGLSFVGVFVDDLIAELMTVMNRTAVRRWLQTPNRVFGGRKPIDLVDDPNDRQLRDVITRAKFNLPAA